MRANLAKALAALALVVAAAGAATAEPLVADLSSHLISINPRYTGTDLLLFGTVDQDGDVVVVVRGPAQDIVVRRKDRLAGVWLNQSAVRFTNVPGFYAAAATRPLNEIATANVLSRHEIGVARLRLKTVERLKEAEAAPYREAIVRNMRRAELYPRELGRIARLGKRLFRTEIHFPANVPVGDYTAEVYLVQGTAVVSVQSTPLFIRKTGIERGIYDYAHDQPLLYGILAVLLAMTAGWLAAMAFRKP